MNATEGLEYTLNSDGTSYSCAGIGTAKATDIVITDVYNGLPITSIGDPAFRDDNLTSVTIPDSVTSIGYSAFDCDNLAKVYYKGTAIEWNNITIGSYNTHLTNATRYYYSESNPTTSGNYWHYDENGDVVEW